MVGLKEEAPLTDRDYTDPSIRANIAMAGNLEHDKRRACAHIRHQNRRNPAFLHAIKHNSAFCNRQLPAASVRFQCHGDAKQEELP